MWNVRFIIWFLLSRDATFQEISWKSGNLNCVSGNFSPFFGKYLGHILLKILNFRKFWMAQVASLIYILFTISLLPNFVGVVTSCIVIGAATGEMTFPVIVGRVSTWYSPPQLHEGISWSRIPKSPEFDISCKFSIGR